MTDSTSDKHDSGTTSQSAKKSESKAAREKKLKGAICWKVQTATHNEIAAWITYMQSLQTADEQEEGWSKKQNSQGWSKIDAAFFAPLSKKLNGGNQLDPEEERSARNKLPKYWNQLRELFDEEELLAEFDRIEGKGEYKQAKSNDDVERRKVFFENGGKLYLEILTTNEDFKFAFLNNGKVELVDAVEDVMPVELPRTKEGELAFIVKMPNEHVATCEVLDAEDLLDKIKKHIQRYCEMPDMDAELCAFYVLFTWFYKKTNTVGYLRFIADTGKGKSRMTTVVSDVCFYPTSTGGSSSFSGLMRTNERWHGTLIIDEADMSGEKQSQVIKYLNLGFESGKYFVLSDKQDPKKQEVFDPFTPKIIGMREHFRDNATEGRLLSISAHERTNEDIPIILKKEYYAEARQLRNMIARFVLARWQDVNGEKMSEFKGMGIEPRLQQLAMPLSIIFQLWNGGEETFKNYIVSRQKELKKTRSQSWHGSIFNLVYAIAKGDEDIKDGVPR